MDETGRLQERVARPRLTRRHLLLGTVGLVGFSAASLALYASAIEPMGLTVTRYAPALPNWPAGRKLTITVVADIHAGGPDMTLEHIVRVVDTANALRSDLTVLLATSRRGTGAGSERRPCPIRHGRRSWRGCNRRSAPGLCSAITIGGTISAACARVR